MKHGLKQTKRETKRSRFLECFICPETKYETLTSFLRNLVETPQIKPVLTAANVGGFGEVCVDACEKGSFHL